MGSDICKVRSGTKEQAHQQQQQQRSSIVKNPEKENPRTSPLSTVSHLTCPISPYPDQKIYDSLGEFQAQNLETTLKPKPKPEQEKQKEPEENHTDKSAFIVACELIGTKLHPCLIPLVGVELKRKKQICLLTEIWKRKEFTRKENEWIYDAKSCSKAAVYRVAYCFQEVSSLLSRSFSSPTEGPTIFIIEQVPADIKLLSVTLYTRVRPLSLEVTIHSESFPEVVLMLSPTSDILDIIFRIFKESQPAADWERDILLKLPIVVSGLT